MQAPGRSQSTLNRQWDKIIPSPQRTVPRRNKPKEKTIRKKHPIKKKNLLLNPKSVRRGPSLLEEKEKRLLTIEGQLGSLRSPLKGSGGSLVVGFKLIGRGSGGRD